MNAADVIGPPLNLSRWSNRVKPDQPAHTPLSGKKAKSNHSLTKNLFFF
jgi:hypothetical protein